MIPRPFETKQMWRRRQWGMSRPQFEQGIRHLRNHGYIKIVYKQDKRFIQITADGQLYILLKKAKIPFVQKWDGKWRVIIFDIPESSNDQRKLFRKLLRINNFYKLQASVYISPYPLNRDAVAYLKQTGLIAYIHIMRVEELDDDKFLRKHFNLE